MQLNDSFLCVKQFSCKIKSSVLTCCSPVKNRNLFRHFRQAFLFVVFESFGFYGVSRLFDIVSLAFFNQTIVSYITATDIYIRAKDIYSRVKDIYSDVIDADSRAIVSYINAKDIYSRVIVADSRVIDIYSRVIAFYSRAIVRAGRVINIFTKAIILNTEEFVFIPEEIVVNAHSKS